MSVLANKQVLLVVAEASPQTRKLKSALETEGMKVHTLECELVTPKIVKELNINIVFLNHLHELKSCTKLLRELTTAIDTKSIPVFTLVQDIELEIQNVLSAGAADYITDTEDGFSIIDKVKSIFGQNQFFQDTSVIDISTTEPSLSTSGVRVYVVEDDPLLRNLLSIRLSKSKFPFEFSSDGKDVLEPMHQFKPDVIILDLMLPGISGLDVLKSIKGDDILKEIPVIVFSNRDNTEDKMTALNLGAAGYYIKAMTDLSELVETIQAQVKK